MFVVLTLTVHARDVPPEYKPFEKLIGKWRGQMKMIVDSQDGKQEKVYKHEAECWFDQKRAAIEMIDTDTDTKTGAKVTTHSEIRWDNSSKSFKAMFWGQGGIVRLYVIKDVKGVLHYENVDRPIGKEFTSQVRVGDKGQLIETGRKSYPGAKRMVIQWSCTYTRVE